MKLANLLTVTCALLAVGPAVAQHAGHGRASSYAGEQDREIKALSAQEQREWTEGEGIGLAKAAELNGYPGPLHVLELADRLQLTPEQSAATRSLMHEHKADVRRLGVQLVEAERELDRLFRDKRATEAEVRRRTEAIAQLQAQIRSSHLQTHLRQTAILDAAQVERYNTLRGYR
ncbi:MAG: hypothetical protein HY854_04995 [Burkholderiales bacterium]|nr:hypothetical protein [Burkholderiales bacterium]